MSNSLEAFRGQIPNELLTALQQDASVPTWPDPSAYSGYFLSNDGAALMWSPVSQVPAQATHSGKFLTTNGTVASWAEVPAPEIGDFVFDGAAMDIDAAGALTIGGANATSIAFTIDGVDAGALIGTGGNVALRAPSTFKYAGIEADAGAGYVRCGSATGTIIAFGDNRITFADNITINLTNAADRSVIFTENDVEFGRIKEDGAGGMLVNAAEEISLATNGTVRFKADATGIGFFATAPVAKQSIPASPTTAEIATLLETYGLATLV